MGCCFSKSTTQKQNPPVLKTQQPHEAAPPPPPPPPLEEESVKEVLSETPISKPQQVPILIAETKTQMAVDQNPVEKFETKGPVEEVSEVVSQVSEVCSITESFSTTTTTTTNTATVTEKREDEATSKQSSREGTMVHKRNISSPSRKRPYVPEGNLAGGRERRVRSPARRSEPSPEKKVKGSSRIVRGRESCPVANRRINAGPAGVRRDSGEGSGRRSRSPSCARTAGGTRKVSVGGDRKQLPAVNGVEKEKKSESEEVSQVTEIEDKNDVVSKQEVSEIGEKKNDVVLEQEECLENPHVSMECFIFL